MKKIFKISILFAAAVLILFSCQTPKRDQHRGPSPGEDMRGKAPSVTQDGAPGTMKSNQAPPEKHDRISEIYTKFILLIYSEDAGLALSPSQIDSIKITLIEWKNALLTDPGTKNELYEKRLLDILTKEQLTFILPPMEQGTPPAPPQEPGKKGGSPESNRDYIELIDDILNKLS